MRPRGAAVGAASLLALLVLVLVVPALLSTPVRAQNAQTLAAQYAPELHFTKGEQFYPTTVDYIIGSSNLMLRGDNGTATPVSGSISPDNLGTFSNPNYFLDNRLSTESAIAADYAAKGQPAGYTAYVNVASAGSETVIQYWLFYAYNNGPLNDHQGDIEVVEVFLDSSGAPVTALYSQHFAGESAAWGDVEKSGSTHPVVYVAQGSHANYFRSFQGRIGIENDVVGNDGLVISPGQLNLVTLSNQSWLSFQGRWGDWGTDLQVAQGQAGPYGPVYNQDGIRWSQPENYLSQTFPVSGTYFDLAWIAANFLLLFLLYTVIRAGWKVFGIVRLQRKGTLVGTGVFKGRLGAGVALVLLGVAITVAALFLPWYEISSTSAAGPLGALGTVNLLHLDGIGGLTVNFFAGSSSDASSGLSTLLTTQVPFAIVMATGVVLLILDFLGYSEGKKLGRKFLAGAIMSLVPFILIFILISMLPMLLPFAQQLLPGQTVPPGVSDLLHAVGSNPVGGSASQVFPIVGNTTVQWGFGIGAYLFVVAAVVRIVGAVLVWGAKPKASSATPAMAPPPAPPAPVPTTA